MVVGVLVPPSERAVCLEQALPPTPLLDWLRTAAALVTLQLPGA